jgi:hypothetical protein
MQVSVVPVIAVGGAVGGANYILAVYNPLSKGSQFQGFFTPDSG